MVISTPIPSLDPTALAWQVHLMLMRLFPRGAPGQKPNPKHIIIERQATLSCNSFFKQMKGLSSISRKICEMSCFSLKGSRYHKNNLNGVSWIVVEVSSGIKEQSFEIAVFNLQLDFPCTDDENVPGLKDADATTSKTARNSLWESMPEASKQPITSAHASMSFGQSTTEIELPICSSGSSFSETRETLQEIEEERRARMVSAMHCNDERQRSDELKHIIDSAVSKTLKLDDDDDDDDDDGEVSL